MSKKKTFCVGRSINGISLNGLEYLLDDHGQVQIFESVNQAKPFMKKAGVPNDALDSFVFEPISPSNNTVRHDTKSSGPSF